MTVYSVSLWGHSKHLVSSIMSPAGDRPPERWTRFRVGLVSHPHGRPRPPGQSAASRVEVCPRGLAQDHMQAHRCTQRHIHPHAHTPNANLCEPTGSLCTAETPLFRGEQATPKNDSLGCRALRGSDRCLPLWLRSTWQETDTVLFLLIAWFCIVDIACALHGAEGGPTDWKLLSGSHP